MANGTCDICGRPATARVRASVNGRVQNMELCDQHYHEMVRRSGRSASPLESLFGQHSLFDEFFGGSGFGSLFGDSPLRGGTLGSMGNGDDDVVDATFGEGAPRRSARRGGGGRTIADRLKISATARPVDVQELEAEVAQIKREQDFRPEFGARELRRLIRSELETELAREMLSGRVVDGDKVRVVWSADQQKVVFEKTKKTKVDEGAKAEEDGSGRKRERKPAKKTGKPGATESGDKAAEASPGDEKSSA